MNRFLFQYMNGIFILLNFSEIEISKFEKTTYYDVYMINECKYNGVLY